MEKEYVLTASQIQMILDIVCNAVHPTVPFGNVNAVVQALATLQPINKEE
jgi:hypothetical protein